MCIRDRFLSVGPHQVRVKVIRSKRFSERMSYVQGSHAILSIPSHYDQQLTEQALSSLHAWLLKMYEKKPASFEPKQGKLKPGETIQVLGREYQIALLKGNRVSTFRAQKKADTIYIEVPPKYQDRPEVLSKVFPRIVCKVFHQQLIEQVALVNQQTLGVSYGRVTIKDVTSLWGSCTVDNHLMFSSNLMLAPLHIINHVILHELAHVLVKDHSERFWALVAKYDKDWKENDRWLSKQGKHLDY